jgi:hypothetical protein
MPPPDKQLSTYQKSPKSGMSQLYQQYQQANEAAKQERKTQLANLWEQQKQAMRRISASAKLILPRAASYHLKRTLRLQARNTANEAIANVRRTMTGKRAEIRTRHKPLSYIEWLKSEAEHGNIPAIFALRKRGAVAPALINITARDLRDTKLIASKIVHATGRGTLFYKTGKDIFRDSGSHLSMKKDVSDQGVKAALMIAMSKFHGQPLMFNGSDELREKCVEVAAAREGLRLTFADPDMERERQKKLLPGDHQVAIPQMAPATREKTEGRSRNIPHRELADSQTRRGISR